MLWKICIITGADGDASETIIFAARELKRYITLIDCSADAALLRAPGYDTNINNAIWVGRDPAFTDKLPRIPENGNPKLDDGVLIDVSGNSGVITGVNDRSVLLAVYRYLTELGCAWVRPGADGEIIPKKPLGRDRVYVCETPSYRHRSMEIEGSNSYDHVQDLIEWIPKIGMSALFIPFFAPFAFYERWYCHRENPYIESTPVTVEETKAMTREHAAELKKRGLLYHAIGHGWTCEAFGIGANDWNVADRKIPDEYIGYFPMIDGARGFFNGVPIQTNLCFSNVAARNAVTSFVAEYCMKHTDIDYLHFWLSDSYNSHCECDGCKDTIPSDYYVTMLNEIDEKLTDAGLNTKIVFLLYFDLLWAPQKTRINNPDRFVLMFAPISRTYSRTYSESDLSGTMELPDYVRNKLTMPRSVEENVARLRRWQELFSGDSFIFDYHFFVDHYKDPGYSQISRVLFDDIENLDKLGLNGTVNCMVTRPFFPTGLGIWLMAKALWNREADYGTEADAYYIAAFGEKGRDVRAYLEKLSDLFDPQYLRHEKPQVSELSAAQFDKIGGLIDGFDLLSGRINEPDAGVQKSWEYLRLHAQFCRLFAKALYYKASGKQKDADIIYRDVESWARLHDSELSGALDFYTAANAWKNVITEDEQTFVN